MKKQRMMKLIRQISKELLELEVAEENAEDIKTLAEILFATTGSEQYYKAKEIRQMLKEYRGRSEVDWADSGEDTDEMAKQLIEQRKQEGRHILLSYTGGTPLSGLCLGALVSEHLDSLHIPVNFQVEQEHLETVKRSKEDRVKQILEDNIIVTVEENIVGTASKEPSCN